MKLATYKDGSRDGQLVLVSRDLSSAHYATGIASRLQQVLDDWNFLSPQLQDLYVTLNQGKARHAFPFDPQMCMAPLPRAYQRAVADTYLPPSAQPPVRSPAPSSDQDTARKDRLCLSPSDALLGACDEVPWLSPGLGLDFSAELAAVMGDVPRAAPPEQALDSVRLLMLVNAIHLREAQTDEPATWPPLQPATAFSPVAVTPDELGEAWRDGRVHLTLHCAWNGRTVGMCEAGEDQPRHVGEWIAQLCQHRAVRAGSLICTGPVRNQAHDEKGRPAWPRGYSSIADKRTMETLLDGQPATGYLRPGDTVRIEMKGRDGQSVFGAISNTIAAAG